MNLIKTENLSEGKNQESETKTFEQLIDSLIQENKGEITTKELKELRFNKYQIEKLKEQGIIERINRGLYQVPKVIENQRIEEENNKIRIQQTNFNLFKCSVLEKNFKEAYQYLRDTINTRFNHAYDDHYHLYLRLLKEILGEENYNFSMLENGEIYVGTDSYEIGSTIETFTKFKFSVLSGDFEQASNYINEFEIKRKRHENSETPISTKLFLLLTNEICEKQKNAKEQEKAQHFNQFYIKIREKNFKEAYQELCKAIDSKGRNYYGLFFILLKELLNEEDYDFSFLENGVVFMPSFKSDTEYINDLLNKFKDAVLDRDFKSAIIYIQATSNMEKKKNNFIKPRTEIYRYLIDEICKKKKNAKEKKRKQDYNQFYIKIREKNFKEAYQELYKAIDPQEKNYYGLLFTLLKELLNKEDYDFSFLENGVVFMPSFNSEPLNKFKEAVLNKDFRSARTYINEEIEREIETREHKSPKTLTKIYSYLIDEIIRKQMNHINETYAPSTIPAIDIPKIPEEKSESNGLNFNKLNIQYLISQKRYKEAKEMLEKNPPVKDQKDNFYFLNILKMLNLLEKLETSAIRFIDPLPSSYYQHNTDEIFPCFFEALEKEDFETAYNYALKCREKEKVIFGKAINFETYLQLLNSILLYKDIKECTHKKEFTRENLADLRNLYQEKISFSTISKQYDIYVLDILGTLEENSSANSNLDFCRVKTKKRNIINQFEDAMNLGDYDTACNIMKSHKWRDETKNFSYKDQIILISKVLVIMNNKQKSPVVRVMDEKELEQPSVILEQLQKLKDFIEADDFEGCKQYLNQNPIEINPKFLEEFKIILNGLSNRKKASSESLDENPGKEKKYKLGSIQ